MFFSNADVKRTKSKVRFNASRATARLEKFHLFPIHTGVFSIVG